MPRGNHAFLDHWRLIRPYGVDLCTVLVDNEKWYVMDDGLLGYLTGIARGHSRLEDGHRILTSEVLTIAVDRSWAITRNTHYSLGRPNEGPNDPHEDAKLQFSLGCGFTTVDLREMDTTAIVYGYSPIAGIDLVKAQNGIYVSTQRH